MITCKIDFVIEQEEGESKEEAVMRLATHLAENVTTDEFYQRLIAEAEED